LFYIPKLRNSTKYQNLIFLPHFIIHTIIALMKKIDVLGKLFGSSSVVKIMRLFLFNADKPHSFDEVSKKVKYSKDSIRKEVLDLESAGFIKKKLYFQKVEIGAGKFKNKKCQGFILNKDFHYLSALQNLLIKIPPFTARDIERRFKGVGSIKLLIISGVFIQEWDTVADILIVGDNLNTSLVDRTVASLESEIGRELTYVVFDTGEFEYRMNVYDKLIRDILDYPHQKIVNRLGI